MRLIKKILAISMVTALTFTSLDIPARAIESTNTESVEAIEQSGETVATQESVVTDETNAEESAETDKTNTADVTETETSKEQQDTDTKEEVSELQKLFNDALSTNNTVTLEKDLQVEETIELVLPKDMEEATITLELNGHQISSKDASVLIYVSQNVILNIHGEGSVINEKDNGIVILNEGTTKLDNANLLATGEKSVGVLNNSILKEEGLIIKSGTIKADWFAIGRSVKADVSINRPTAFFADNNSVDMSDITDDVEQGSYKLDENASVLEEESNSISITDKIEEVEETDNEPTDNTKDVEGQDDTKQEGDGQSQEVSNDIQEPVVQQEVPLNALSQQTPVTAPVAPANVTATAINYNSIQLTWNVVSGANGYIVERIQTDNNTVLELTDTAQTSYTDTNNILVGKEYKYRVYAYINDTSGKLKSTASTEVTATTTISNPQNLSAVQASATSVKLTWSGVEGATKYKIYRAKKGGDYKLIKTTTSTNYKDSKLKTGTKYYYKVTAVNGDFESGFSNKVSLYAAAAGATKLKASSSTYNKIDLSWKKASGATKYVIYRSTKEGSGYKKIKSVTTTKYTDKVKTGVTYYYKVVSYSKNAKGGESKVVSGVAVSAAPTNVKAVSKANNSVKISWSKSKGAGNYAIYRSTSKKSGYTLIKTVSSSKTSYTDKSVATGTTYYYKVCAVTKNKEGKMSKVVSVKVKPNAVSNLTVKSAGGKNVILTWSASNGATSYKVYRSTKEKSGYSLLGTTTDLSFTNKKLKNGTTYYYRVAAVTGKVESDYKVVSYVNPSKVYLNSNSLYLESGETAKLKVSFKPEKVSDSTITWSSANTKIATVSKKGVVTAIAEGVTTITATTVNGLTATCEIGVDQEQSGVIVVLDPGHGGSDHGAVSGSLKESVLNLKISQYTKAELEKYSGITVKMTRTGDTYVGLEERTQIAKNYDADILVSQHLNSASPAANGAEVYVSLDSRFNSESSRLGSKIVNRLTGLGLNNRGVKTRQGTSGDYYSVIRNSVSRGFPGIIVESAFITGSEDREILSTEAGLKSIGVATATAIAEYYGLSKK